MITFKNFDTGDRATCARPWAALFLLGPIYLFLKGDYRNMYRYCVPWVLLGALASSSLWLQVALPGLGLFIGLALAVAAVVLWVMCVTVYPSQLVRDLFVEGYVPINSEQWSALEASGILSEVQYKSFAKLHRGE